MDLVLKEQKLNAELLAKSDLDLAQFAGVELDVADNMQLYANDILIPKLWLIQASSELRKARKAQDGDYVDSRSEQILWSPGTDKAFLPIIVLKTFKRWHTFTPVVPFNGKNEFVSSEVIVLGKNHDLPYQENVGGKDLIRRQVISAYVVLGEDLQKGIAKPYIIDFASTSKGAGRDLITDISTLNKSKLPAFTAWFKLSAQEESKDTNTFFVKKIAFGGAIPKEVLPLLTETYKSVSEMIANNTIEIDDRDLKENSSSTVSAANNADV